MAAQTVTRQRLLDLFLDIQSKTHILDREIDFRQELDAKFGDYKSQLKLQIERLQEKCPLVVVGDTSAGKSSFLNLMLGKDIFPTDFLHATAAIVKLQKGSPAKIVTDDGTELPIEEGTTSDPSALAASIEKALKQSVIPKRERGRVVKEVDCKFVDVFWPHDCRLLREDMTLVDTPGFDKNEELQKLVVEYLPKAVAFIYVIDVSKAGGVEKIGGLQSLLIDQLNFCKKNKLEMLDPKRAIFVCNKWDLIPSQHEENVWEHICATLEDVWPNFSRSQAIKFSVIHGAAVYIDSSKAQNLLHEVVAKSLEESLDASVRWLKPFMQFIKYNIETHIAHAETSIEEKETLKESIAEGITETEKMRVRHKQELRELIERKTDDLAERLSQYLRSDETRRELKETMKSEDLAHINLDKDSKEEIEGATKEVVLRKIGVKIKQYDDKTKMLTNAIKDIQASIKTKVTEIDKSIKLTKGMFKGNLPSGPDLMVLALADGAYGLSAAGMAALGSVLSYGAFVAFALASLYAVVFAGILIFSLGSVIKEAIGSSFSPRLWRLHTATDNILEQMTPKLLRPLIEEQFEPLETKVNEIYDTLVQRELDCRRLQLKHICDSSEDKWRTLARYHALIHDLTPVFETCRVLFEDDSLSL